jgi:AcrR family transcriptional regulator
MGRQYHDDMEVPYEDGGRREQKARTRQALVSATRALLAEGTTPRVEEAAARAGISRTTAYRYFSSQRSLLLAAHPEIENRTLLPDPPPLDPQARLALVIDGLVDITIDWEPQLRTSLRLSLEPDGDPQPLRQGRAIGWIEDALAPLRESRPSVDVHRLAVAIRSATGIESLVWLTDIAGLSHDDSADLMRWSAGAMLRAALEGDPPPSATRSPRTGQPQ